MNWWSFAYKVWLSLLAIVEWGETGVYSFQLQDGDLFFKLGPDLSEAQTIKWENSLNRCVDHALIERRIRRVGFFMSDFLCDRSSMFSFSLRKPINSCRGHHITIFRFTPSSMQHVAIQQISWFFIRTSYLASRMNDWRLRIIKETVLLFFTSLVYLYDGCCISLNRSSACLRLFLLCHKWVRNQCKYITWKNRIYLSYI